MRVQKLMQLSKLAASEGNADIVKQVNAVLAAQTVLGDMCKKAGGDLAELMRGGESNAARDRAKTLLKQDSDKRAAERKASKQANGPAVGHAKKQAAAPREGATASKRTGKQPLKQTGKRLPVRTAPAATASKTA